MDIKINAKEPLLHVEAGPIRCEYLPSEKALLIHYAADSFNPIYDIYDINGSIHITGRLEFRGTSRISTANLFPGNYALCIIDGDKLVRVPLNLIL